MSIPPLETERLRIRPFGYDDLDAIFEVLDVAPGDIENSVAVAQAKGDRQRWLEESIRTDDAFARLHQPPSYFAPPSPKDPCPDNK